MPSPRDAYVGHACVPVLKYIFLISCCLQRTSLGSLLLPRSLLHPLPAPVVSCPPAARCSALCCAFLRRRSRRMFPLAVSSLVEGDDVDSVSVILRRFPCLLSHAAVGGVVSCASLFLFLLFCRDGGDGSSARGLREAAMRGGGGQ